MTRGNIYHLQESNQQRDILKDVFCHWIIKAGGVLYPQEGLRRPFKNGGRHLDRFYPKQGCYSFWQAFFSNSLQIILKIADWIETHWLQLWRIKIPPLSLGL